MRYDTPEIDSTLPSSTNSHFSHIQSRPPAVSYCALAYEALDVTQSKIVFKAFSAKITCFCDSFKYFNTSSFPPPGLYSPN
mmetsp:Transcript_9456/g.21048  ORF Transcript_9456/g.21048 Transcript_9456/m.21048 type:complete len:81 (-) Transcript_9456:575-817(-)